MCNLRRPEWFERRMGHQARSSQCQHEGHNTRFPSNPLTIRVPFFLLFNFNKETPK